MSEERPTTIGDSEPSRDTAFSRDDWRPGEIARNTGTGILKNGDVLFGAYEITGMLGKGGMGAVYSAKHLSLESSRAIKVMSAALSANLDAVERFHREAKALLEVHHPAVVRCHDLLRDEHGCIYLVMELIDGMPLSRRMAERPLNERELRELAERIGSGLMAAHDQGVIHRDLSPDNVVLPDGEANQAKLVDFGIAKVLRDGESTLSQGFKGKLAFASPEQMGFFDGEIGTASDFFSLGLLLCAAAVGRRLDMGKNFATAVDARRTPIRVPDAVPASLRPGIAKLLTLDPADRPESVEGLFDGSLSGLSTGSSLGRRAIGVAAGLAVGIGVGAWVLQEVASRGGGSDPLSQIADVSAPLQLETPSGIDLEPGDALSLVADEGSGENIDNATRQLFEDLRTRLIGARSDSLVTRTRFEVMPNPVQDKATYTIEIEAGCACYPFVFFIDANQDAITLLYPNPNEPRVPLAENHRLTVPSRGGMYSFEAEAGTGIDRLKLILLSERVNFPAAADGAWKLNLDDSFTADDFTADYAPTSGDDLLVSFLGAAGGDEFWSASPLERDRENLTELAKLLDHLDESAWTSAETVLHVVR
jgi:hypothetical protein